MFAVVFLLSGSELIVFVVHWFICVVVVVFVVDVVQCRGVVQLASVFHITGAAKHRFLVNGVQNCLGLTALLVAAAPSSDVLASKFPRIPNSHHLFEGGECFAPHPHFACQNEVLQVQKLRDDIFKLK